MARLGQKPGRPCTGLLFIILLSSLEGHALADRAFLELDHSVDLSIAAGLNATVARGNDDDLQCVAVLCWLETFQKSGAVDVNRAFVETDRALAMANLAGVELGKSSLATVADVGLVGTIIGGLVNAIKAKGEGCKGNALSCVGKASLAVVVIAVVAVVVFIVGHVVALGAAAAGAIGLSLGSLGAFFGNFFKYLCSDSLDANSAQSLVQETMRGLERENPGKSLKVSSQDQDMAARMLLKVQAGRKTINGDHGLASRIASGSSFSRVFQKLLGLTSFRDVQSFCAMMQVAANPRDPRPALREEMDGGEIVIGGPPTRYAPAPGY